MWLGFAVKMLPEKYKEKRDLLVMNSVAKAIDAEDAEKAKKKAANEALRAAKWY
jgi:hypothetical protein